ncbi:uncharacterized protein IL334_003787 [Kwoniella shivajii]|uniref:Ricin B lectin domain-containing protein n=1 Tax=Kwoniella shivajii TaxID=564305 RepID=A0ABZ1CZT0_9TREE|nr:hypothetical protein IL334_003787 [Kwoniella shivajii]
MFLLLVTLLMTLPALPVAFANPISQRYSGVKIKSERNGKCLSAEGGQFSQGVMIITVDCAQASVWDVERNIVGSIILSGSGLALDAGNVIYDHDHIAIWNSHEGIYGQKWVYTQENRLLVEAWTILGDSANTNDNTDSTPRTGKKIHSNRNNQCLSPENANLADGIRIIAMDCAQAVEWEFNAASSGSIIVSGTSWAMDAGDGYTNNEEIKIWTSYPGIYQQTWFVGENGQIKIADGNQCLDQGNDIEGTQTYQCSEGNINQEWSVL